MLHVARKKEFCKVLGPGTRSVIWFHGCLRQCPGCIAGTMNELAEYETFIPQQLADWVKNNIGIEGITLSGGEPFQQPRDELAAFLMLVKQNVTDLSVLCYTGYRYEELNKQESAIPVLQHIDVLIDGEYRENEDFGQRWRGSDNQQFHFLTKRYKNQENEWNHTLERQIEIELDMNGKLLISGVPSKDFINKLTMELQRRDVNVDFS
ncbi:MAG: radical SAM protein [Planctomycetaceae bacterium]|jgi:anaerobic ribonucleoside-triphosphate reductase activating protein|nr:radical SAM protein [Planctomycetaceae bacterium]